MAAAPAKPSRVNEIADAVLAAVSKISRPADMSQWLTVPRAFKRMLMIGDLTIGSRPLLCVQVLKVDSEVAGPAYHEGKAQIGVHIVCDGDEKAEVQLNDIARDIIYAVHKDETLGGKVRSIYFTSYEPQYEVMQKSGFGVATVAFEATYEWAHAAP